MTGSCSVCLYIDSPFALLGMVHIRPFELQIFRYSVFMLSCSIKMWKHVAFLSIPNSCLNLTLFIHRPYVFPPVRICFLHPTLTMRKQPTSFPWCAPHFFLGWMIPWINKTLEGHRDLGQVELLDPKWLNTQFARPVATHIFFCLKFSPWKNHGGFMIPNLTVAYVSWLGWDSTMNWKTSHPRRSLPQLLPLKRRWRSKLMILVNAGSDLRFFVREGKGVQECEWHTTICRICIEIYIVSIFGVSFVGIRFSSLLEMDGNGSFRKSTLILSPL